MALEDEVDPLDARPGPLLVATGATQMLTALVMAVQAAQLWTMFRLYDWMQSVPYALIVTAVALAAAGGGTLRGRDRAAIAAWALSWLSALGGLAFILYTLRGGIIALPFVWAGLALLASALAPFAAAQARHTSRAQRALYDT